MVWVRGIEHQRGVGAILKGGFAAALVEVHRHLRGVPLRGGGVVDGLDAHFKLPLRPRLLHIKAELWGVLYRNHLQAEHIVPGGIGIRCVGEVRRGGRAAGGRSTCEVGLHLHAPAQHLHLPQGRVLGDDVPQHGGDGRRDGPPLDGLGRGDVLARRHRGRQYVRDALRTAHGHLGHATRRAVARPAIAGRVVDGVVEVIVPGVARLGHVQETTHCVRVLLACSLPDALGLGGSWELPRVLQVPERAGVPVLRLLHDVVAEGVPIRVRPREGVDEPVRLAEARVVLERAVASGRVGVDDAVGKVLPVLCVRDLGRAVDRDDRDLEEEHAPLGDDEAHKVAGGHLPGVELVLEVHLAAGGGDLGNRAVLRVADHIHF
mmetsp:Transcript_70527/g.223456  ORF Transcript_70527/g.223456 Transcript_70527/m.223456 type:complete len:376 (-) Transcript_70527:244-1371(-)